MILQVLLNQMAALFLYNFVLMVLQRYACFAVQVFIIIYHYIRMHGQKNIKIRFTSLWNVLTVTNQWFTTRGFMKYVTDKK